MGLQPLAELGSLGGSVRESLPSLFQNWALRGRNESGGKGGKGHSQLREQPLQRKVQGGELGLGVAGAGRPLGRFSDERQSVLGQPCFVRLSGCCGGTGGRKHGEGGRRGPGSAQGSTE